MGIQPIKRAFTRKFAYTFVGIGLALLLSAPWAIYELGLSNIATLPVPPDSPKTTAATEKAIWDQFEKPGPVAVTPMSPYSYIAVMAANEMSLTPGARIAWFVARNHNAGNLKNRRTIWWHLSGIALTIWLTRNWSTDQLIAKANEISSRKMR